MGAGPFSIYKGIFSPLGGDDDISLRRFSVDMVTFGLISEARLKVLALFQHFPSGFPPKDLKNVTFKYLQYFNIVKTKFISK